MFGDQGEIHLMQPVQVALSFRVCGLSSQSLTVSLLESRGIILGLADQARGESRRLLHDEIIIQQVERLWARVLASRLPVTVRASGRLKGVNSGGMEFLRCSR